MLIEEDESQLTKKDINQRKNAARSIPYWLGNDPDCFTWTMEALQLKPGNSMEYRQLYLDSLVSFYDTIKDDPKQLSMRMTMCLEQLVDVGFDDLQWSKQYRKVNTFQENERVLQHRLAKKFNQFKDRVESLETNKEMLEELEREMREVLDGGAVNDEFDEDDEEELDGPIEAAGPVETSSSGFFSTVIKRVSSFFQPSHPASTPLMNNATPESVLGDIQVFNRRTRKRIAVLQRRIDKQVMIVEKAKLLVNTTQTQLDNLQIEIDSLDPVMSLDEYERLSGIVKNVLRDVCPELALHMQSRHRRMIEQYQVLDSKTDLTKPHEWYMHARLDRRKVIFHGGPTNSGKTYTALQRLKEADRGLYVGPLRLLAAEIYETLTSQGVYTNLYTGQEAREIPFATHCAATVELAPTDQDFDVVVIDEIQMVKDQSRGYAWTRALLGVRCKEIHVCGGLEAEKLVRKIAKACGDDFELKEYERFSPLCVSDNSLSAASKALGSYRNVKPGDCVVAFSRADIFAIKREVESTTSYKCCIIYGSLPPETRSEQARLFNNPDSGYDILVASDAIGMGLNLNIRRIIFNSMFKSNGERIIQLDHSSVKQIAGRAGRRNSPYPEGEVTCRDPEDMAHLRKCMNNEIVPITKAGLLPTSIHVELFSEALQTYGLSDDHSNLHKLMAQFSELATLQGDFFLCRQHELLAIARTLTDLNLPLRDKFLLCMSPVNVRNDRAMATLRKFAVKQSLGEVAGLSRQVIPKKANSFDDMGVLCELHSDLDLFLWLHQRFPGNVMEQQSAMAMKELTIKLINKGLRETDNLRLDHCYITRDTKIRKLGKESVRDDDDKIGRDQDPLGRGNMSDLGSKVGRSSARRRTTYE